MGGLILLFIGLFWLVVLLVMYFISPSDSQILIYFSIPGVILFLIGAVMEIVSRIQMGKYMQANRERQDRELEIDRAGIPVRGRVTFVDRNYSYLVNNNPVYSIVEYKFVDHRGVEHTGRNVQVPSEVVIRNQIAVGSEVDLKYLSADPEQHRLMLPESP